MKRFQLDVVEAHQQRPDAANIPRMFRTHAQPHRHAQADILDERAEFEREIDFDEFTFGNIFWGLLKPVILTW